MIYNAYWCIVACLMPDNQIIALMVNLNVKDGSFASNNIIITVSWYILAGKYVSWSDKNGLIAHQFLTIITSSVNITI